LDVPYVVVSGSSGSMGGSISHEFQFPADIGQDRLLICPECERGSNVEVSDQNTISGKSFFPTSTILKDLGKKLMLT
jgi:prolyl-tRNA synthetase